MGQFVKFAPSKRIGELNIPGLFDRTLPRNALRYFDLPKSERILERKRRHPRPEGCCW